MRDCLLGLVFCLMLLKVTAQDSIVHRFGVQFSYHPYDFFSGFQYERENGHHQHQFQVSVGINSTFFQRRLYPQVAYQYGFHLVKNRFFQTGPFVRLMSSMRQIDKHAVHGNSFNEDLLLGAYFGTGDQHRVRFSMGIGPSAEHNWSVMTAHYEVYWSWNYVGEISYAYAF